MDTKKQWKKKLRIWRKICNNVRIVEVEDQYEVQSRHLLGLFKGMSEWETLNTFSSMKGAIHKKNMYIVMILIPRMNLHVEFKNRRKGMKKVKYSF